jgi:hypothetical protein
MRQVLVSCGEYASLAYIAPIGVPHPDLDGLSTHR